MEVDSIGRRDCKGEQLRSFVQRKLLSGIIEEDLRRYKEMKVSLRYSTEETPE